VGPGVFFALFGVTGLIYSVRAPLHVEYPVAAASPTTGSPQPLAADIINYDSDGLIAREEDEIKSINTLESLWERHPPVSTPEETQAAKDAFKIMDDLKLRILKRSVPNFDWYNEIRKSLEQSPDKLDKLSPDEREKYRTVDRLALGNLFSGQKR
jgi:hypothetical protein